MKNISKMPPPDCYCGQNGDHTLNMLECVKCRRWFHEGCIKCLELPMLSGDRFYIFICSVCNAGSECLARIELKWQEIAHLLLYNLAVLEKKKYFHLDNTIVPFLNENWERFYIFGSVASDKKNARSKLLKTLESCQNSFKCGKEVKKCKNIWALRVRVPPEPLDVVPSTPRIEKDVVVWDFKVKDRAYHIITVKKPTKCKENYKSVRAKTKPPFSSSVRHKNGEVSKCRGSVPHNENGIHKIKHKVKRTTVVFDENSARFGLLDSLIPFPPDFNDCNNPFAESFKGNYYKQSTTQIDKAPIKSTKRQRDSANTFNLTVSNGNHQLSDDNTSTESTSVLSTKDANSLKEDFCIMGKRITSTGKVQYLFQRNRAKTEEVVAEVETVFQITYFCKCSYCTRLKGTSRNVLKQSPQHS